jgi:hypothetical protein
VKHVADAAVDISVDDVGAEFDLPEFARAGGEAGGLVFAFGVGVRVRNE